MFFKDSPKWHFTFKTWKSNQSFFARAQIFRRIARSITIFFCLENWLICRSHLKQFIAIQIRKTFLFTFLQRFFMNQLAVVRIFLRSGTLLKNDHFHWFWSVISRFSSIKWRGKMSIWGHFLLVYFLDLLRLVISFHPLDFGTFLKAFVSLLPAFHFLFLTFQTIRRSSLDHCALLQKWARSVQNSIAVAYITYQSTFKTVQKHSPYYDAPKNHEWIISSNNTVLASEASFWVIWIFAPKLDFFERREIWFLMIWTFLPKFIIS